VAFRSRTALSTGGRHDSDDVSIRLQCKSYVPLLVFLVAAEQTGAVDDRIQHRVGHSEEKYPDEVSVVDVRNIHERVDDERHLANVGINNDISATGRHR